METIIWVKCINQFGLWNLLYRYFFLLNPGYCELPYCRITLDSLDARARVHLPTLTHTGTNTNRCRLPFLSFCCCLIAFLSSSVQQCQDLENRTSCKCRGSATATLLGKGLQRYFTATTFHRKHCAISL